MGTDTKAKFCVGTEKEVVEIDENAWELRGDAKENVGTAWGGLDPFHGDGENPKICVGTIPTNPHTSPRNIFAWGCVGQCVGRVGVGQ